MLLLVPLSVRLGGVVTLVHNQILRSVVFLAAEVRLKDALHTSSIAFLGIDGGTGHVRNRGVATAPWILGVAERVFLRCWLWEPHVTTVATKVAALESLCYVFLDDNGATSGVDQP